MNGMRTKPAVLLVEAGVTPGSAEPHHTPASTSGSRWSGETAPGPLATRVPSSITDAERATFLAALAKDAQVVTAARKAGRLPQRFYELRRADPFFAREWDAVLDGRRGCGYRYRTEAERKAARRATWRRYQQTKRAALKRFPTEENYALWLALADPMLRWWLERFPLADIAAMGSALGDGLTA